MQIHLKEKKKIRILFLSLFVISTSSAVFLYAQSSYSYSKDNKYTILSENTYESIDEPASQYQEGFYNMDDTWYYYEDGIVSDKTDIIQGTVNNLFSWWYVVDGQIDFTYNGLIKNDDSWCIIKNGEASLETNDSIVSAVANYMNVSDSDHELVTFGGYSFSSSAMELLTTAIQDLTSKDYETGFVVMDLKSLQGFAYNADYSFYSASTIKGPYVASLVSSNENVMEEESTAIHSILEYSDNEAYYSLRNLYGSDCLQAWCNLSESSLTIEASNKYQNYTPRQLADLWIATYFFFMNSDIGQDLATWFESPDISAIHIVLGSTYTTRSKAGWIAEGGNYSVTNDAGIVYVEDNPYLISIMSSAPSDFDAVCTLVEAIELVHQDMISYNYPSYKEENK